MSLYEFAKSELSKLEIDTDDKMQPIIHDCILESIEAFSKPDHSGTSAAYTADLLLRLLNWKPITSLTGNDDEWNDIRSYGEPSTSWQNKRCSSVFKDEDGTAWYLASDGKSIEINFPFVVP